MKYYGNLEVKSQAEKDNQVVLELSDGTTETLSKKMSAVVLTDEPLKGALTELREIRLKPVVEEILKVLLEWDIKPFDPMNELEYAMQLVKMSFVHSLDKANDKLWKKEKGNISFSDVNNVLKQ